MTLAAFQSMTKQAGMPLLLQADSMQDKSIDVRISLNPSKVTTDLNLSASTTNEAAKQVGTVFEKYFRNNMMIISFGQQGSFGQTVSIAAKLKPKLNTTNLMFYSYDKKTGVYKTIAAPKYSVDTIGYIHFNTELAGSIIISDGPLTKK